jgi:hypothetical protein
MLSRSGAPQRSPGASLSWNFLTILFGRLPIHQALLFSRICHNKKGGHRPAIAKAVTANQEVHPFEHYILQRRCRRYQTDGRDDRLTTEI